MKRIMHYFTIRRRAIKLRRLAGSAASAVKTQVTKEEISGTQRSAAQVGVA